MRVPARFRSMAARVSLPQLLKFALLCNAWERGASHVKLIFFGRLLRFCAHDGEEVSFQVAKRCVSAGREESGWKVDGIYIYTGGRVIEWFECVVRFENKLVCGVLV